jgi:hypothetical protein
LIGFISAPESASLTRWSRSRERIEPALQEIAFARVRGSRDRRFVRLRRVRPSAEPPEEVGADRVKQIVALDGWIVELLDELQRCRGPIRTKN